jgi:hypothetical protein
LEVIFFTAAVMASAVLALAAAASTELVPWSRAGFNSQAARRRLALAKKKILFISMTLRVPVCSFRGEVRGTVYSLGNL